RNHCQLALRLTVWLRSHYCRRRAATSPLARRRPTCTSTPARSHGRIEFEDEGDTHMRTRAHRLTTAGAALTAAAVAAAALTACAPQESGPSDEAGDAIAPMTLTLGHSEASEGLPAEAAERYAELVGELTDGAVTIEVFPAGQLGSLYEMQETLEVG